MKASRQNKTRNLLSMLLSLILIFGSASFSTSLAASAAQSTHWVKQSPGITQEWHPLIDEFESLGLLDAPMTRGAFEILIQNSFEGLEAFEITAGSSESREVTKTYYVTRMEGAFYLHHLMKAERIMEQQLYTDQPDIPSWALESVLGMTQKGIFKGFPDGSFKSRQWLTHAEAICLVAKSQLQWMREGLTAVVPTPAPLGEPVVTVPEPQPEPQPEPDPDQTPQPEPPVTTEPPVVSEPPADTEPAETPEEPAEPVEPVIEAPQPDPVPQPEDPQPTDPQPENPQPVDPLPEEPQTEDPQPQVPEAKPTHTAEILMLLPEGKTHYAYVPIELYLIDPDLNTDPNVVETAEVLMFSYDQFESVITMTEISADSDHFLAWITPVFEPGEDPFEFRVCEFYTIGAYIDYYDPVNADGVTNYFRSMSFDVQPFED
ncbi:MAG: hypothetical protein GT601_01065 [Acidaminobacter sp.]|uniref:S-layer homology domain-containing protein n=1 Tax=Acidaminobacter sp. TaxID=1872102 RepID=UPI001380057C|nr:S-layer homology domain-containing protein [Acidaminobacter sp.]MZQ96240.1 hypothetical protein [Acidaminobacter sp.]